MYKIKSLDEHHPCLVFMSTRFWQLAIKASPNLPVQSRQVVESELRENDLFKYADIKSMISEYLIKYPTSALHQVYVCRSLIEVGQDTQATDLLRQFIRQQDFKLSKTRKSLDFDKENVVIVDLKICKQVYRTIEWYIQDQSLREEWKQKCKTLYPLLTDF